MLNAATVIAALIAAVAAVIVAIINALSNRKNLKAADINALKDALNQHIKLDGINAKAVCDRLDVLERHSTESYMESLWNRMRDKALPLEERAEAAQRYLDAGYNGARKIKADAVVREYAESLGKENADG